MKNNLAIAAAVLLMAGAARADVLAPTAAPAQRPALTVGPNANLEALKALEAGEKTAGAAFDGEGVPRRDGPVEIVAEEKDILLDTRHYPGRWRHTGGGRHGEGHDGWYEPTRTVRVYGDRQTVRIIDREGYVSKKAKTGALWVAAAGGAAGLLLAFLVNPLLGLAVLGAGVAAGYYLGKSSAAKQPETFSRDVEKRYEEYPYSSKSPRARKRPGLFFPFYP